MNHFQKAQQKGKKEFEKVLEQCRYKFEYDRELDYLKSFLDSYSEDIRKAVIEDLQKVCICHCHNEEVGVTFNKLTHRCCSKENIIHEDKPKLHS